MATVCHTALVVAVPTPDDQRRLTNPLTAVRHLVVARTRGGLRWPGAVAGAVSQFVRNSLLIVAGLVGLTVTAFQWHPIAGWGMASVACLLLDLCIRGDQTEPGSGGP